MSKPPAAKRHGNARLSLECKPEVKREIEDHAKELGQWSIIGTIRESVRRSKKLLDLERRGEILLLRDEDGEVEEVPK